MKIAIVTAIVGSYEATCKPVVPQTEQADFFVYTDNPAIETRGVWKVVDANKYRYGIGPSDNDKSLRNSMANNQHTFNRAKFFKLNLHRLHELQGYDVLIWLDGTIYIHNPEFVAYMRAKIEDGKNFIVFEHNRNGLLKSEVDASHFERYTSRYWFGQKQPYQDVDEQYAVYCHRGFKEHYFGTSAGNYGLWVTCCIAFNRHKQETVSFLDKWWDHNMQFTTQDQISFPYICWENAIVPYSLPTDDPSITGDSNRNTLFVKTNHGL